MKLKQWTIPALLIVSAASVSGCAVPGDFCDVVKSPIEFEPETARQIVKTDRREAEEIATQNEYGSKFCKW